MNSELETPIVCELSQSEQRRCAEAYRNGLFSQVEEVRACAGGYSLRFDWKPERVREAAEFVALDSSCCSFLNHALEVPPGKKDLWLHLAGPDAARGVLDSEISQLLPEGIELPQGEQGQLRTKGGVRWAGFGLSGIGIAAALCCAAPAIGALSIAAMGAWFIDAALAISLTVALVLIAWLYLRRTGARNKQTTRCC